MTMFGGGEPVNEDENDAAHELEAALDVAGGVIRGAIREIQSCGIDVESITFVGWTEGGLPVILYETGRG